MDSYKGLFIRSRNRLRRFGILFPSFPISPILQPPALLALSSRQPPALPVLLALSYPASYFTIDNIRVMYGAMQLNTQHDILSPAGNLQQNHATLPSPAVAIKLIWLWRFADLRKDLPAGNMHQHCRAIWATYCHSCIASQGTTEWRSNSSGLWRFADLRRDLPNESQPAALAYRGFQAGSTQQCNNFQFDFSGYNLVGNIFYMLAFVFFSGISICW